MLSDAQAKIIPAFGIANPQFKKSSSWYGVALPIIFVVDKDGTIRHRFSTRNYRNRPETDVILEILKKDSRG
jgi:peroxiredoxin